MSSYIFPEIFPITIFGFMEKDIKEKNTNNNIKMTINLLMTMFFLKLFFG